MSFRPALWAAGGLRKGIYMRRRGLLIGGLGLSVAGAMALAGMPALAQESASDSAGAAQTRDERIAAWEEAQQQRYEDFLAKFAENLGVDDPAQVETALKETLKQMIDEELAAGTISANAAAEMKERIDAAEGPALFGGFGGHRGRGGRISGRQDGPHMFEPRDDGSERAPVDDGSGEDEALPATDGAASTPTN